MSKESTQLNPELEKWLHIEYPEVKITEESINNQKNNPDAPIRQFLGLARTPEERQQYSEESLRRPLP